MKTVGWFVFALMLGVLVGAGGAVYVVQSDAGNLLVRHTDVVHDLQRRLDGVEEQRNQLSRQLEDVIARSARMEQAFSELEKRFRSLSDDRQAPPPGAPPPPQVP